MRRNLSAAEIESFRARLCAVATRLFAEGGRDGVSMRQLADELGCSPMTPYRYFRDKDEILAAVRAAAFDRFAAALEEAAAVPGDARTRARAVGEAYIRFAFGEPHAYRLMFDLSQPNEGRFPELARAGTRARRTMSSYVADLIAEGFMEGDPELLGHLFWAAIHGLVVLELAGKLGGGPDFATLHREMSRLLATGARGLSLEAAKPAPAPVQKRCARAATPAA